MASPYLTIAGPIGVGKSTLAAALAKHRGYACFLESAGEKNPFLAGYYQQPKKYAFRSQCFFIAEALRQTQEIAQLNGGAIQDRSLAEHMSIFIAGATDRGEISADEHQLLTDLTIGASAHLPAPDLMIYLQTTPQALRRRIKERGRDYERSLDLKSLGAMIERYDRWLASWRSSPLLRLDVGQYDVHMDSDLGALSAQIDASTQGMAPSISADRKNE